MFGITTPPSRQNPNHGTQNKREEIRSGSHSGTYDASGSDRMKMEYLKKEKERRDKERARLEYDSKKREYDGLMTSEERFRSEQRRLNMELERYEHDSRFAEEEEKKKSEEMLHHKKEAEDLGKKIQRMEVELASYKNQYQRFMSNVTYLEQREKTARADAGKKESYVAGIKSKIEISKRNQEHFTHDMQKLAEELEKLKRSL